MSWVAPCSPALFPSLAPALLRTRMCLFFRAVSPCALLTLPFVALHCIHSLDLPVVPACSPVLLLAHPLLVVQLTVVISQAVVHFAVMMLQARLLPVIARSVDLGFLVHLAPPPLAQPSAVLQVVLGVPDSGPLVAPPLQL